MTRACLILTLLLWITPAWGESFQPLNPAVEELPGGATLLLLEDHEFPTVELIFFFPGGSLWDPPGKEGLATLALQSLRLGGSVGRPASEIEEELDFIGASLEVGHDRELAFLQLRVMRKELAKGLGILFDLLKRPAFEPEQVEIARNRFVEKLRRDTEDPLQLAFREFPALVYGKKSAWGRTPTPRSVKKIPRKDLLDYHRRLVGPNRIVGGVSGDISPVEVLRDLKIHLADWPRLESSLPPVPAVEKKERATRTFLPFSGLKQSTVLVGHLSLDRTDPDKFSLVAVNYLLGGSGALSSRLGEELRTETGMAYSVWSHVGFAVREGLFYAGAQTSLPQTGEAVRKLDAAIRRLAAEPAVTEAEARRAKNAILRSLFFDYETRFALVTDLAKFRLWGYPDDYLKIFQERIGGLTPEEMNRAAREHFKPDALRLLVVGDPEALQQLKGFGSFGKVKR